MVARRHIVCFLLVCGSSPLAASEVLQLDYDDERIFEVLLNGSPIIDAMLAYEKSGVVYLPLSGLASELEMPVDISLDGQRATGWTITPNHTFRISLETKKVQLQDNSYPLKPGDAIGLEGEIYVRQALVANWFHVNMKTTLLDQRVNINSSGKLPLEQRLARQKRIALLPDKNNTSHTIEPLAYGLATPPAFDTRIGTAWQSERQLRSNYSINAYGDLFYSNMALFMSGSDEESLDKVRLSLGRESVEGDLLGRLAATRYLIGDTRMATQPLIGTGSAGVGFNINNAPLDQFSRLEGIHLRGNLPKGQEVELYVNGLLIEYLQDGGEEERYEFLDIPVKYGVNELRLAFYDGNYLLKETFKTIDVNNGLLMPGEFYYTLDGVDIDRELVPLDDTTRAGEQALSAAIDYGLHRQITLKTGVHRRYIDGEPVHYYSIGPRLRVGEQSRLNLQRVQQEGASYAWSMEWFSTYWGNNYTVTHERYQSDFASDEHKVTEDREPFDHLTTLKLALPSWQLNRANGIDFSLDLEHRQYPRNQFTMGAFEAGLKSSFGSIRHVLTYSKQQIDGQPKQVDTVGELIGRIKTAEWLEKSSLRFQAKYRTKPGIALQRLNISGTVDLQGYAVGAVMQKSAGEDPQLTANVSWKRRYQHQTLSAAVGADTEGTFRASVEIAFGHTWDPIQRRYRNTPDYGLASRGSSVSQVFIDYDRDQQFSTGDELLPDAGLLLNNQEVGARTDADGHVLLRGMGITRPSTLGINYKTLKRVDLQPHQAVRYIRSHPGVTRTLSVPLHPTAELEGYIYTGESVTTLSQGRMVAMPNVRVQLLKQHNDTWEIVDTQTTEFDGLYVFEFIPYGQYKVRVDPQQVVNKGLAIPAEYPVQVDGREEYISGLNILLEPEQLSDEDKYISQLPLLRAEPATQPTGASGADGTH